MKIRVRDLCAVLVGDLIETVLRGSSLQLEEEDRAWVVEGVFVEIESYAITLSSSRTDMATQWGSFLMRGVHHF